MQSARAEPPYAGLRVLELARVLAGPWIGQTLADLGAQVVKVESPEGDETRRWGPPFLTNADGSAADAAYFHSCNRGKESLVLDFRRQEDRERVVQLAREADVLIENFKVGGLAKYGLDYPSLAPLNPRLVYCSISGFGQSGRYADRPGYDFVAQAMSGLMDVTGEPGHPPQKVGVAVSDIITGLYGLIGIQAALAERARSGRGQQVDVALLDSTIAGSSFRAQAIGPAEIAAPHDAQHLFGGKIRALLRRVELRPVLAQLIAALLSRVDIVTGGIDRDPVRIANAGGEAGCR